MKDFTLITVSTHRPHQWYYTYDQFFVSAKPYTPIVLDNTFHHYSGLGSKPKMLYKAIKNGFIKTSHTFFLDSWDMFFASSPQVLFEKYFELDSPIVISSEKNCFPGDLREQYNALNPPTSYKYLNSGMIVGETEAILAALEAMDLGNVPEDYRREDGTMYHINDQALWLELFLKQPIPMKLDYYQSLCQTLHDVKADEF